jgi:TolB-like protein
MKFFDELKRRKVIKSAIAYSIVAWLIAQVASIVLPTFNAPSYFMKTLIFILALGFPVSLIFAWIYEMTPEGIKKTEDFDQNTLITSHKNSRLNKVITGSLILVIILLIFNQYSKNTIIESTNIIDNQKSIAVLPFDNMSGDTDQEIMCDGLTEEIIHYLAIVKVFDKVISRSSVMTFKKSLKTTTEIAKLLDVNFILEGSYRQSGDRLRITAQLIEASTDNQVWSEIYERPTGDIFDIQSNIAKNIASKIKGELSSSENYMIRKKPTDNLEAYNSYIKGRFHWHKRTKEDLYMSLDYYNQALELDSTYALAYAGLADTYNVLAYWGWYPQIEGYKLSETMVKKAILLDDQLPQAYAVLGALLIEYQHNFKESEKAFKKALELNPGYATAHQYYAELLNNTQRKQEARKEIDLALLYNPFSIIMHNLSGWFYLEEGLYEEALQEGLRVREIDRENTIGNWLIFYSYLFLGMNDDAVSQLQKEIWPEIVGDSIISIEIKNIYSHSGLDGIVRWLIDLQASELNPNYVNLARLNLLIGNNEEAIKWFELGFEKNDLNTGMKIVGVADFQPLFSHPRFVDLVEKFKERGW